MHLLDSLLAVDLTDSEVGVSGERFPKVKVTHAYELLLREGK